MLKAPIKYKKINSDSSARQQNYPESNMRTGRWVGFIAGLLIFSTMILSSPPEELSLAGWRT
ncbi:MAG: hypothetical protein ACFCU6_11795, partial [Balneolaceae bacterium]